MDHFFTKENITKKNIIIMLVVLILAVSIPLGVRLVQEQTRLKSRATGTGQIGVRFQGPNVSPNPCIPTATQSCAAVNTNIQIEVTSPFGAP